MVPAKTKAPVSKPALQGILLAIQSQRLNCNQIQAELVSKGNEIILK